MKTGLTGRMACCALVVSLASVSFSAQAVMLSVEAPAEVAVGNTFSAELVISELGNGTAPSLGAFDVDLLFDANLLAVNSVSFGNALGDPDLFEAIADSSEVSPGTLNLNAVSLLFDFELDGLQADSFTLATVEFNSLAQGTADLLFAPGFVLSDALAISIDDVTVSGASVTALSEPGVPLMLAVAGLAMAGAGRRRST